MPLRRRADYTATSGESEREDRDEPRDDDWSVEHGVYLEGRKPQEDKEGGLCMNPDPSGFRTRPLNFAKLRGRK